VSSGSGVDAARASSGAMSEADMELEIEKRKRLFAEMKKRRESKEPKKDG